jgi:hypothetical protein
MAKQKKRGMPTKICVDPKCAATMHARTGICPKCGKEQPKKVKPKPKAKPVAAKPQKPSPGGLPEAISFIRQVGGLQQAKGLLNQIEEIKKL